MRCLLQVQDGIFQKNCCQISVLQPPISGYYLISTMGSYMSLSVSCVDSKSQEASCLRLIKAVSSLMVFNISNILNLKSLSIKLMS